MGLTGRYNFTGIQKAASVGINALLASVSWGAYILASPILDPLLIQFENFIVNWLANRGLIVLNIQAISIDGSIDQARLDAAMNDALTKIQNGRDKITPAQGAAIDAEVASAFDQDADLGATNGDANSVPNVSGPSI